MYGAGCGDVYTTAYSDYAECVTKTWKVFSLGATPFSRRSINILYAENI